MDSVRSYLLDNACQSISSGLLLMTSIISSCHFVSETGGGVETGGETGGDAGVETGVETGGVGHVFEL